MGDLTPEEIASAKDLGDLSPACYTPSEQQVVLPSIFLGLALSLIGLIVGIVGIGTHWMMWIITIVSGIGVFAFLVWIWLVTMKKACIQRVPKSSPPIA